MTEYLLIEDTEKFRKAANKSDAREFLQYVVLEEASEYILNNKDKFKLEQRDNSIYLQIENVEELFRGLLVDTLQKVVKRFAEEREND